MQTVEDESEERVSEERVAEVRRQIESEMACKMQQDRSERAVARAKAEAEKKAKCARIAPSILLSLHAHSCKRLCACTIRSCNFLVGHG